MKRVLFCLFCFFLSVPSAFANEGYVFILNARGNPYWTAMADGIRETAKAKNMNATIYQSESDRAVEEELNKCLDAVQQKPKAIVMAALTPSLAVQCFKQAQAAGVVVADIDANLSVEAAQKAGIKLAFSVGSDNFAIGQEAAKYAASIAGKADPHIFILEGAAGSTTGKKRADGFRTKLAEVMPAAVIVASMGAEWDRMKAMNATADILLRDPNIDIIYAANDTMALGASEAVRNAGGADRIKVIGVDGTSDARTAIKTGRLMATVAQLPYLMGKRAVERVADPKIATAEPQTEMTPTPVLTKKLIDEGKDPLLQYVR